MNDRSFVTIGYITKTHGFDGAVAVRVSAGAQEPKINEPVFIAIDGIPVPFFVRESHYQGGDTMILAFDDYETPESVLMLKGCEVRREADKGAPESYLTIEGYIVSDINSEFTGEIVSVVEQPHQILATVMAGGRELLIPLHSDLIVSINHRKKKIVLSLPDGLTDLNN